VVSLSGVSHSAIGRRNQEPAADTRRAGTWTPDARARHPSPWIDVVNFCTFAQAAGPFAPLHFTSRHLPPGAATRHPKRCIPLPLLRSSSPRQQTQRLSRPILDTPYSVLSYSTFAPLHRSFAPVCTFARSLVSLANWPTGQPINSFTCGCAAPILDTLYSRRRLYRRADYSEFKCNFDEYPCSPSARLETNCLILGARPTTRCSVVFGPSCISFRSVLSAYAGLPPVRAGATSISANTVINTICNTGTSDV